MTKCVYITLSSSLFVSFTFSKDTTWKWRIIKQLRVDDDDGKMMIIRVIFDDLSTPRLVRIDQCDVDEDDNGESDDGNDDLFRRSRQRTSP